MLIPGYPEGSDITLLNTMYHKQRRLENGKYSDDYMTIVYKDNITGEKKFHEIKNPTYRYYMAKDNVQVYPNMLCIEKDKVDMFEVPFKDLLLDIAKRTGNEQFYFNNIRTGNRYTNNQLHTHQRLFMSDQDIDDHYRFRFDQEYTNRTVDISKAFFDIETDIIDMNPGDDIKDCMGYFPVNAVTLIDKDHRTVTTVLLRNKKNPQVQEFENYVTSGGFEKELRSFVTNYVGWKNEKRMGIDKFKYEQVFYDEEDELQMISDLFMMIKLLNPDFIMAYNTAFDLPYLIERIKILGGDPNEIICHPDFKNKGCYYYVDERNRMQPEQKGDYAFVSSYQVYTDQQIHFFSRRKGQAKFPNYKLETVGKKIGGFGKLDYSHITHDIALLPYKSYKTFVIYNIVDVLVQFCVEEKSDDIGYVFNKALMNNVRYHKAHRQTIYLVDRAAKEFYNDCDMIIGNNRNKFNEKPKNKFPGALVGDPTHIKAKSFININGKKTGVFNNGDDFDYASLYPSIINEFNIAPNTQIGKLIIPKKVFIGENPFISKVYDRGGNFLEDFQSKNYIQACHRWFGLANSNEILEDVKEYFTKHRNASRELRTHDSYGRRMAVRYNNPSLLTSAVRFSTPNKLEKAVSIHTPYNRMMDGYEYEKIHYDIEYGKDVEEDREESMIEADGGDEE